MESEFWLRMALIAVVGSTVLVGGYYRLQAAASGEKISRRDEGYAFAALLRSAGAGLFLMTIGFLLVPERFRWATFPLPIEWRWLGIVTGAMGTMLMYWTLSNLGKNLTDTVVTRERATLITSGPYRWVRHPFYGTAAWSMISVTVTSANWLIGLLSLLVLSLLAIRTPMEEEKLIARFGDDYRQYMRTTGRFWPRIWR